MVWFSYKCCKIQCDFGTSSLCGPYYTEFLVLGCCSSGTIYEV